MQYFPLLRSSNGCRTRLSWRPCGTSPSGKRSVMSRASHTAHFQTLARWTLGSYRARPCACTLAWSAQIITHGSLTPLETDSLSRNKKESNATSIRVLSDRYLLTYLSKNLFITTILNYLLCYIYILSELLHLVTPSLVRKRGVVLGSS